MRIIANKLVVLAVALSAMSVVASKTEVMVFFDTEDFTSNRANDAVRDLANLCSEELKEIEGGEEDAAAQY